MHKTQSFLNTVIPRTAAGLFSFRYYLYLTIVFVLALADIFHYFRPEATACLKELLSAILNPVVLIIMDVTDAVVIISVFIYHEPHKVLEDFNLLT